MYLIKSFCKLATSFINTCKIKFTQKLQIVNTVIAAKPNMTWSKSKCWECHYLRKISMKAPPQFSVRRMNLNLPRTKDTIIWIIEIILPITLMMEYDIYILTDWCKLRHRIPENFCFLNYYNNSSLSCCLVFPMISSSGFWQSEKFLVGFPIRITSRLSSGKYRLFWITLTSLRSIGSFTS